MVRLVTQTAAASSADRQTRCCHDPDARRVWAAHESDRVQAPTRDRLETEIRAELAANRASRAETGAAARHGAADKRVSNTILFDRPHRFGVGRPAAHQGNEADGFDLCGVKSDAQLASDALAELGPVTAERHADGERRGPDSSAPALIGRFLTPPGET
jgi:hypothetical protein